MNWKFWKSLFTRQKPHDFFALHVGIAAGVITLFVIGFYLHGEIKDLRTEAAAQSKLLSETREVMNALASGNAELASQLSSEQEKRLAESENAQSQIALLQTDLTKQQQEVSSTQQALKANDIASVVQTWDARIAKITCTTTKDNGEKSKNNGSGTLMQYNGAPYILTNKHVMLDDDSRVPSCSAFLPESNVTLKLSAVSFSASKDVAYAKIADPTLVPKIDISLNKCATKPATGDRVVMLGYPSVGADDSVTATEGIISGFDDGDYVSSAKIEHGNSGGAAILIKDNCFIGLPTTVVKGKLESLARILPL